MHGTWFLNDLRLSRYGDLHKLKLGCVNPAVHVSNGDEYREDGSMPLRSRDLGSRASDLDARIELSKRAVTVLVMVKRGGLVDALVSRHTKVSRKG
jgi:hypothetical protein